MGLRHAKTIKEIHDKRFGSSMYVEICSIDCDQYESTNLAMIPATHHDYVQFENQLWEEAEGSFSIRILTEEQGKNWKQQTHDHRAEQYNYQGQE